MVPERYEPTGVAGAVKKNVRSFLNNPSIAGIVITNIAGDFIYCSSNWNPDQYDVKEVIKGCCGGIVTSVKMHGVIFSIQQSRLDRFISTNIKKAGYLIGAATPGGQYLLAFILPSDVYDGAFYDLIAAAGMIHDGTTQYFSIRPFSTIS
jgi:hypothetical protein